jgi:hypothetical protein
MDEFDRMKGVYREAVRVRDRTGLVAGLVKWLVVRVRQKVTIYVSWFACIRSFTTVYGVRIRRPG